MISGIRTRESGFPASFLSAVLLNGRIDFPFFLCALTAIASLCLGGGTHSGFLSDAILQLVALPLLLVSIRRCLATRFEASVWLDAALWVCIVALPVAQVIPLAPSIWTGFPLRGTVIEAFTLTGQTPGWMPLSLLPDATASAALSLIAPLALFWATRQLGTTHRRYLVLVILVFAGFSVFFGMAQLAGGQHSRLRLFPETNSDDAVGFFANRNHFSALLYAALLFASVWAIDAGLTISNARRRDKLKAPQVIAIMASLTLMFIVGAAQIMARSRAGVGLTLIALLGIVALTLTDPRNKSRKASVAILLVAAVAVFAFTAQFGLSRFAARLVSDPMADARVVFGQTTIDAARAFFPFGSGVGTFPSVYPLFEKPGQLLPNIYANHAHDDYLEVWLESGLPGVLLLAALGLWVLWRSIKAWTNRDSWNLPIDILLKRSATMVVGLLCVHSLVDYPLRTSALMSLMAISCALLTPVPRDRRSVAVSDRETAGRTRRRHQHEARPIQEPAHASLSSAAEGLS